MKASAYADLRLLIDRESVLIAAAQTELIRELLTLRVDFTPSGTEKIEARVGHDDLADALMLSTGPYRTRSGRWRTMLRDAVEAEPLTPAPFEVPGPLVKTGGGFELPRQPAWQSTFGPEVSLPPGGEFESGEDPIVRRVRERVREIQERRQWVGAQEGEAA
ncbi:MAG: hypothetical protein M3377_07855 [Actinomycetota bacterium]|nr:hypothetical protein [Actinomycetota bacterium]